MSPVLVTGSGGFFGSAIVAELRAAQIPLRTTDLSPRPKTTLPDYHSVDLTQPADLSPLVDRVRCIVHAAGLAHQFGNQDARQDAFVAVNVTATRRLMQAAIAAGVEHFVLISSVSVYGPHGRGPCDESAACRPVGAYARSKLQAEQSVIQLAQESPIRVTILRVATLYGEGDPGNVARLMRAIDSRRFIWIGSGNNLKSLIHREDAARACVLAATHNDGPQVQVYNVSSPPHPMHEIVDGLAAALERRVCRWRIPAPLALLAAGLAARCSGRRGRFRTLHAGLQKWLADDVYDAAKFQQAFDFHPQVPLGEGLRREVHWYRASAPAQGAQTHHGA